MKPRQLETRTTQDILNGIVCGEWREPVEHVRSLPVDSKAQIAAKNALPYVIWAGEYKPRNADGLIRHSGQVGVDLDDLTPAQAKGAMHAAMDDKYCLAAFRSVRFGVRLLFRIPPVSAEIHSKIFVQVAKHVRDVYGLKPDMTGRNVCRLSLVSWDKGLWICPEAAILPITLPGPAVQKELAVRSAPIRQTAAQVTKPESSAKQDAGVMWLGAERGTVRAPHQSAQPMPRERLGSNRAPPARHGCAFRQPETNLCTHENTDHRYDHHRVLASESGFFRRSDSGRSQSDPG